MFWCKDIIYPSSSHRNKNPLPSVVFFWTLCVFCWFSPSFSCWSFSFLQTLSTSQPPCDFFRFLSYCARKISLPSSLSTGNSSLLNKILMKWNCLLGSVGLLCSTGFVLMLLQYEDPCQEHWGQENETIISPINVIYNLMFSRPNSSSIFFFFCCFLAWGRKRKGKKTKQDQEGVGPRNRMECSNGTLATL